MEMINGDASAHLPDLPDDLIIIILSKLPLAKLYSTCSLVSKSWRRDLVRLAAVKREADMADFALIGFWVRYPLLFKNACLIIPGNCNSHGRDPVNIKIRLPKNESWELVLADACNGFLLLFNDSERNKEINNMRWYYVCNPLTGKNQELPSLCKNEMGDWMVLFSLFVFDPTISPHYKVLAFFEIDQETMSACVFSSDQLGWRRLDHRTTIIDIRSLSYQTTVCINGHAYRLGLIYEFREGANLREVIGHRLVLLKFHVEDESFKLSSTPSTDYASKIVYGFDRPQNSNIKFGLGKAKGCLLYVAQVEREVNMWILEEDEWMPWRKMKLDELVEVSDFRSTVLYPAAPWDEHDQTFYCSAREKLYCYSLKRSTKLKADVVCDWNQLLKWADVHIVPIFCCVHDPTINPLLN